MRLRSPQKRAGKNGRCGAAKSGIGRCSAGIELSQLAWRIARHESELESLFQPRIKAAHVADAL